MKKLNIAFDLTWVNAAQNIGGGFQYSERVIAALVKYTSINVIAIVASGQESIFSSSGSVFASLANHDNFHIRTATIANSFYKIVREENVDLIHAPIQYYSTYLKSIPMVATLHDLQHYHLPSFFSKEELEYREIFYKKVAFASTRIIVSFSHVKQDIVSFFKISENRIDVCQIGTDLPVSIDFTKFSDIKHKYILPNKYLLYSANTWVHKNHVNLISALKLVHDKYHQKISLICTGNQYENYFPRIVKEIQRNNLEQYVNFLGYIPEEDKLLILKNATLVVVPTLYEAGSFPLMEAINYQVPVICSNVTALPEQIGDPRFLFDPHDVDEIAFKIHLMLTNEQLRMDNIQNSLMRTKELRWENSILQFTETYNRAIIDSNRKSLLERMVNRTEDYLKFITLLPYINYLKQGAKRILSKLTK